MSQSESQEHEALCRRCARCCYEKLIVDGHVFTLRKPCRFLDETTKLCRVYEFRHEVNPRCLTVAEGMEYGVFPADCPYVSEIDGYLPAEEGWIDEKTLRKIEQGIIFRYEDIIAEMRKNTQR